MNKKTVEKQMDSVDIKILEILNHNARTKYTSIARMINVTEGTIRNRVQRLKERGIIQGFQVLTDPRNLGFEIQAIISFQMQATYEVLVQLDQLPTICHRNKCKLLFLYRCSSKNSFLLEVHSKQKHHLNYFIDEIRNLIGLEEFEVYLKEELIYDKLS
ncbi:MAG: Lrp/AsnC family transcriptional regulator [Candidatus Hodarchaeales archaeon]|jgi:DNA-binding Lrp family transcriptional regulator